MEQRSLDLSNPFPPTQRDGQRTSYRAADSVAPITGRIATRVLEFARSRGESGFIDEQLFDAYPTEPQSSYRTRRDELVSRGLIEDSGTERPNRRGRDCIVWRAVSDA
jgi:hypothetical protein